MIFVTHDLGIVAKLCDRVAVMYAGTVVEEAPTAELIAHPLHPYAQGLIAAVPDIERPDVLPKGIAGAIPSLVNPPTGCRFNPRCASATQRCREEKPLLRELLPGRRVACHHAAP